MSTKYEPIGNTVLVEAVLPSTTIAIPGGYEHESGKYKVVAVGDGDEIPNGIDVDDVVILSSMAAMVKIKDTNYALTPADSILAVVYDEDEE